ncbi:hypothetical protein BH160DRAFT_1559 [Burkholderia sp. H160]|nr:hypothetical protein BH160DRAFT_1559 [Burkholderia sp. H160]
MFIDWLKAEADVTVDALRALPGYALRGSESLGATLE